MEVQMNTVTERALLSLQATVDVPEFKSVVLDFLALADKMEGQREMAVVSRLALTGRDFQMLAVRIGSDVTLKAWSGLQAVVGQMVEMLEEDGHTGSPYFQRIAKEFLAVDMQNMHTVFKEVSMLMQDKGMKKTMKKLEKKLKKLNGSKLRASDGSVWARFALFLFFARAIVNALIGIYIEAGALATAMHGSHIGGGDGGGNTKSSPRASSSSDDEDSLDVRGAGLGKPGSHPAIHRPRAREPVLLDGQSPLPVALRRSVRDLGVGVGVGVRDSGRRGGVPPERPLSASDRRGLFAKFPVQPKVVPSRRRMSTTWAPYYGVGY